MSALAFCYDQPICCSGPPSILLEIAVTHKRDRKHISIAIRSLSIPANCFAGAHSQLILLNIKLCRVQIESKAQSKWPAIPQFV